MRDNGGDSQVADNTDNDIEVAEAAAQPLDAGEDNIRAALRAKLADSPLHPDHGGGEEANPTMHDGIAGNEAAPPGEGQASGGHAGSGATVNSTWEQLVVRSSLLNPLLDRVERRTGDGNQSARARRHRAAALPRIVR